MLQSSFLPAGALRVPAIDPARLSELAEALGTECVDDLLLLFGQELASRPELIRATLACNDLSGATAEAHALKGAAWSIGAAAVGTAAAALEQALVDCAGACHLHDCLRQLEASVTQALAVLRVPAKAASSQAA